MNVEVDENEEESDSHRIKNTARNEQHITR